MVIWKTYPSIYVVVCKLAKFGKLNIVPFFNASWMHNMPYNEQIFASVEKADM
jgi:hypothetical protein